MTKRNVVDVELVIEAAVFISGSRQDGVSSQSHRNRIISKEIEPCISDVLLSIKGKDSYFISVDVENDQFTCHKRKCS